MNSINLINSEKETVLFKYNDENLKNMKSVQVFKENQREINSIDFSRCGTYLVVSSKDDSLSLYNISRRELVKKLYNRTYGVENAIFTHNIQAVLCSSNKDFRIMYWNLHTNEVMFSFLGHADLITDLNINPKMDTFISTSRDKTSRIWDLSSKKCLAIIQDCNHSCFDNTGMVIASITSMNDGSNHLNLYSEEDFKKGPFNVFRVNADGSVVKQLKFTPDGLKIICNTEDNLILIIDSFEGTVLKKLTAEISFGDVFIKVDVSPDSKYLISGSESGNILIMNIEKESVIASLSNHPLISLCVKFNPVYNIVASSCQNLVLWQPIEEEI